MDACVKQYGRDRSEIKSQLGIVSMQLGAGFKNLHFATSGGGSVVFIKL